MEEYIYLDNAATTFPKPEAVYRALDWANRNAAVNAGRGSYALAEQAKQLIEDTRGLLLTLTKAKTAAEVVFTPSATFACNQIFGGLPWKREDIVYVSPYEHNAVMRTLHFLQKRYGFAIEELSVDAGTLELDLEKIRYQFIQTIDYIIKNKRCICGHEIKKDSSEYFALMEQRNYLPPADVGSIIGDFERTANRWYRKGDELLEEIDDYAKEVDENVREYHDSCNRYEKLQKQLDEHIDFAEKRKTQRFYKSEIQRFSKEKGEKEGRIEACKKRIETTEKEMQSLEARNERNRIWRQRLEIAEELYRQLYKEFSEQENKIFLELNRQIQENFSKMFNAKDKKIELTPKYEIQMLYRTQQGYREEKNLSEGEKIARNFAFIVTIMDFSRRKKQEKTGHETADSDTLPIVLDGPFSKLGDENIELIAKVLPQVSEQVIIFMLKKDWEYTKLDPYVGSRYYIDKKPEESFATIKPAGEETV